MPSCHDAHGILHGRDDRRTPPRSARQDRHCSPGYTPMPAENQKATCDDVRSQWSVFSVSGDHLPAQDQDLPLIGFLARVVRRHPDALLVLHAPARRDRARGARSDRISRHCRVGAAPSGYIDRGDLNWLYKHAVALTFPSRFEGFGLPVLEAMGHGCPVIAAATTALPEVVGASGVLLSPDDPDGTPRAMIELLTDRGPPRVAGRGGHRRTADFRWSRHRPNNSSRPTSGRRRLR